MNCYSFKFDEDALFRNRPKRYACVLSKLKFMLNFEVDKLSLQKIEYEMDSTDYSVDYNLF